MWEMRAVTLLLFVLARREKTVVLLLIGVLLRGPISINGDTDPSDDSALRAMYSSLNSPSQLTKWSQAGGDPCGDSWKGITCSGSSVTEITLSSLGLSGSLGYQLSSLKSLTNLDMSNNNLGNQINEKLPPNLQQLNLTGNSFNGYIPFSICQMTSLKYLNLGHNLLEGKVNDMFGQLSALQILDLSFNSLTGDLPQSFSSLTNMTDMYLQNNRFTGTIDVLANLPLENLNVENNDFSGWIPKQLKNIIVKNGNPLNSGPAPPPPASNGNRNPKPGSNNSQSGGGGSGSKKSGIGGGDLAGIVISILVVGALVAFFIFFYRILFLNTKLKNKNKYTCIDRVT